MGFRYNRLGEFMEENKSRVVKYAELRKQIALMDDYTFEPAKKEEEKISLSVKEEVTEPEEEVDFGPGIKKNTLSVSLDRLIEGRNSLDSKEKQLEAKKAYNEKTREKRNKVIKTIAIWSLVVLILALVVTISVILLFK